MGFGTWTLGETFPFLVNARDAGHLPAAAAWSIDVDT
jgi:hypothetical protein